MSTVTTPIFHPRTPTHLSRLSPGPHTPGWITHIATLLPPNGSANAAFQNPQNNHTLCHLLTHPRLLKLCKSFKRELPNQTWTARDEQQNDDGTFGRNNLEREWEVEEVLEELKRSGIDVAGFDERSTWSLRAVEVSGPFEIRVDANGHESVVEVPDRRHVYM
jgi:hypothetical protein